MSCGAFKMDDAVKRIITDELKVENKTDIDLAVGVEHRGNEVILVLRRRDAVSAAGLIIPRNTINGRLQS